MYLQQIVPAESAMLDWKGERRVPLQANHQDIVKFSKPDCPMLKDLVTHIINMIGDILGLPNRHAHAGGSFILRCDISLRRSMRRLGIRFTKRKIICDKP